MRRFVSLLFVLIALVLLLPPAPVKAQAPVVRGSQTLSVALGIADPLLVSVSYTGAKSGRLGWYVDVGLSAAPDNDKNPDYYPNISPFEAGYTWGDPSRGTIDNYLYALAGPSLQLTSRVRVALGVGYAKNTPLRKWYDPMHILGSSSGEYITDGFTDDETSGLAVGGAIQVRGRSGTTLHLGFASPMNAAQVGIGWTF